MTLRRTLTTMPIVILCLLVCQPLAAYSQCPHCNTTERMIGRGAVAWQVRLVPNDPSRIEVTIETYKTLETYRVADICFEMIFYDSSNKPVSKTYRFLDGAGRDHLIESAGKHQHVRRFRCAVSGVVRVESRNLCYTLLTRTVHMGNPIPTIEESSATFDLSESAKVAYADSN